MSYKFNSGNIEADFCLIGYFSISMRKLAFNILYDYTKGDLSKKESELLLSCTRNYVVRLHVLLDKFHLYYNIWIIELTIILHLLDTNIQSIMSFLKLQLSEMTDDEVDFLIIGE